MLKQTDVRYPTDSLVAAEIAQQPVHWPTTLARVRSASLPEEIANRPVIVTGAGTSAYAAMAVADAWPGARAIATTDLLLQSAEEIQGALPSFADGGLLISLARSGDSPESVGVVQKIQTLFPSVEHLAILCNAEGRLARTAGVQAVCLDPGTNDRSLAMTSSFSNLVLGGYCLRHAQQIAENLPALCDRMAGLLPELSTIAAEIAAATDDRVVFLTSSMHALALESSIKVVELTAGRVMTLAETFLGLRHGPVSLARSDTPILCFASSDAGKRRYEADLLEDLRGRGVGKLVLIGGRELSAWQYDRLVPAGAPELPDFLRIPFEIPFVQLLAFHLSRHVKVNPDDPSPGGIVTRVVKPFRLHDGPGTA